MTSSTAGHRLLGGFVATGTVVVVCLVTVPPLPLALALGAGATALLAQASLSLAPARAPASRHPLEALMSEVERSRRYRRHCTLARVSGAAEDTGETRRTDEVWDIGGDLMLLMPETTRAGAELAVTRLVGERADGDLAIATFPDDALTVHGLLDAIRTHGPAPVVTPEEDVALPVPVEGAVAALGVEAG